MVQDIEIYSIIYNFPTFFYMFYILGEFLPEYLFLHLIGTFDLLDKNDTRVLNSRLITNFY